MSIVANYFTLLYGTYHYFSMGELIDVIKHIHAQRKLLREKSCKGGGGGGMGKNGVSSFYYPGPIFDVKKFAQAIAHQKDHG